MKILTKEEFLNENRNGNFTDSIDQVIELFNQQIKQHYNLKVISKQDGPTQKENKALIEITNLGSPPHFHDLVFKIIIHKKNDYKFFIGPDTRDIYIRNAHRQITRRFKRNYRGLYVLGEHWNVVGIMPEFNTYMELLYAEIVEMEGAANE